MRNLYLFLLFLVGTTALAQEAKLQFINNSPTLGTDIGPVVDVYINNVLHEGLRSIGFREASSYVDIASGNNVAIELRIAPSNIDGPVLISQTFTALNSGEIYTLMLGGVDLPVPQLPDLALFLFGNARLDSPDPNTTRVRAIHGGILLPPTTIGLRNQDPIFNLSYGSASAYFGFDAEELFFFADVQNLGFPLSYVGDFTELGGKSATLFISGSVVNDPEWGLWIATVEGDVFELPLTLLANVQFVNNVAAGAIDVYLGEELWIDNLEFRQAIPYYFIPSENILTFGIAPGGSTSINDVTATYEFGFETDVDYKLVLSGTPGSADFPVDLLINRSDRSQASSNDVFEVNFFHGFRDSLPILISGKQVGLFIDSLGYHNFSHYVQVDESLTYLDIRSKTDSSLLFSFIIPSELMIEGEAVTIFLSQFPDGTFTGYIIDQFGETTILEQLAYARVQIINNVPESTFVLFDNEDLLSVNYSYLDATSYLPLPSRIEWKLSLGESGNLNYEDAFLDLAFTLDNERDYVFIISGLLDDDEYPISLNIREKSSVVNMPSDSTASYMFHGIHGSEAVSIKVLGGEEITDTLNYHHFTDRLLLSSETFYFDIASESVRFIFEADLQNYEEDELVLLLTGEVNGNEAFKLFGIDRDGNVFELPETSIARVQFIHNLAGVPVDIYLNDSLLLSSFQPISATPYLNIEEGFYRVGIAPPGSQSVNDTIAGFDFEAKGREEYSLLISALPDEEDALFDLFIHEGSSSATSISGQLECLFFNSAVFNPLISWFDVYGSQSLEELPFGSFSSYFLFPKQYHLWSLSSGIDPEVSRYFEADFRDFQDQTCVVLFADDENDFDGLITRVVLSNGHVFDLEEVQVTKVQFVNNLRTDSVEIFINDYLLAGDLKTIEATPFLEISANKSIDISIIAISDKEVLYQDQLAFESDNLYVQFLSQQEEDESTLVFYTLENAREQSSALNQDGVDVCYHNGVPGWSGIAILNENGESLTTEILKGEFSDYIASAVGADLREIWLVDDVVKVGSFYEDLRSLSGAALVVWTRSDDPLSVYGVLPSGVVFKLPTLGTAFVQFLNNSPSDALDIYLFDNLYVDSLGYRAATSFIPVPAGPSYDLSFRLAGEAPNLYETVLELEDGAYYIAIANGISGDINTPLTLKLIENAKIGASSSGFVEVAVFHGAQDTDAISLEARNFISLANNMVYNDHRGYRELLPQRYIIDFIDVLSGSVFESYEAVLSGYQGRAGLLFASGLSGDDDASFGAYLLLDSGEVIKLPFISVARVQFIHNALADDDFFGQPIDLYYGGEKYLESFEFRTATGFLELPAFSDFELAIAPSMSESIGEAFYVLSPDFENAKNYIVVGSGILGSELPAERFTLEILENARRVASNQNQVDLVFFHGSPELRGVDILNDANLLLVRDLRFREYSDYIQFIPSSYTFNLEQSGSGAKIGSFLGDFSALSGQSATLFFTGEENTDFAIWAALANGVTFPLEILVNIAEQMNSSLPLKAFPNPFNSHIEIQLPFDILGDSRIILTDLKGVPMKMLSLNASDFLVLKDGMLRLDCSDLISGAYLLQVIQKDKLYHKLIIKE